MVYNIVCSGADGQASCRHGVTLRASSAVCILSSLLRGGLLLRGTCCVTTIFRHCCLQKFANLLAPPCPMSVFVLMRIVMPVEQEVSLRCEEAVL